MRIAINYQDYSDVETEKTVFRSAFPDVEIVETAAVTAADFARDAVGAEGALIQYAQVTAAVIDALPECRGFVRYGVGYDNIDVDYAWSHGRMVGYVPHYCLDEVSNHAMAMLLALNRKLADCDRLLRADAWHVDRIRPCPRLCDCTAGIVGLGNIGACTATKLQPFVKKVLYYDPYVDFHPDCEKVEELHELFAASDYISLHLPLTGETRQMIDADVLGKMKPTAFLINTGRGATVVETALAELLTAGRIAGAAPDVFAVEPLPAESPLRRLPNVILTHHSAWYSEGSIAEVKETAARELVRILTEGMPSYPARGVVDYAARRAAVCCAATDLCVAEAEERTEHG